MFCRTSANRANDQNTVVRFSFDCLVTVGQSLHSFQLSGWALLPGILCTVTCRLLGVASLSLSSLSPIPSITGADCSLVSVLISQLPRGRIAVSRVRETGRVVQFLGLAVTEHLQHSLALSKIKRCNLESSAAPCSATMDSTSTRLQGHPLERDPIILQLPLSAGSHFRQSVDQFGSVLHCIVQEQQQCHPLKKEWVWNGGWYQKTLPNPEKNS